VDTYLEVAQVIDFPVVLGLLLRLFEYLRVVIRRMDVDLSPDIALGLQQSLVFMCCAVSALWPCKQGGREAVGVGTYVEETAQHAQSANVRWLQEGEEVGEQVVGHETQRTHFLVCALNERVLPSISRPVWKKEEKAGGGQLLKMDHLTFNTDLLSKAPILFFLSPFQILTITRILPSQISASENTTGANQIDQGSYRRKLPPVIHIP